MEHWTNLNERELPHRLDGGLVIMTLALILCTAFIAQRMLGLNTKLKQLETRVEVEHTIHPGSPSQNFVWLSAKGDTLGWAQLTEYGVLFHNGDGLRVLATADSTVWR